MPIVVPPQSCSSATTIAIQLSSMAARIDTVHAAILDLLSRICDPLTGIKEVWEFLTDQDEDEIKKIAQDIRTSSTSSPQKSGAEPADRYRVTEASTILSTMTQYAEKEWDHFLHHTDVGRALNQVGQYERARRISWRPYQRSCDLRSSASSIRSARFLPTSKSYSTVWLRWSVLATITHRASHSRRRHRQTRGPLG